MVYCQLNSAELLNVKQATHCKNFKMQRDGLSADVELFDDYVNTNAEESICLRKFILEIKNPLLIILFTQQFFQFFCQSFTAKITRNNFSIRVQ